MYTQEQYTILCAAIAQGALRVEYGDKRVEYRSLADMRSIKAEMERELFPNKQKSKTTFASYSKDLNNGCR